MKQFILATIASLIIFTSLQASTLNQLITEGNTLWSQGKLDEAEEQFLKALKIDPESSLAHTRLANFYLTQNKIPEAIEEFQNAITSDPENASLFVGIAIAYLHQKYYQMAESMVNHAIQLNPELENAQKLKTYIDAKKDQMNNVEAHEDTAALSIPEHVNSPSPHGSKASSVVD